MIIPYELIQIIVMTCSINSLEDNKSNWTEFNKMMKLQRDCRTYYYECVKRKRFIQCDMERKL